MANGSLQDPSGTIRVSEWKTALGDALPASSLNPCGSPYVLGYPQATASKRGSGQLPNQLRKDRLDFAHADKLLNACIFHPVLERRGCFSGRPDRRF